MKYTICRFLLFCALTAAAKAGRPARAAECARYCLQRFVDKTGAEAFGDSTSHGQVSWSEFLKISTDKAQDAATMRRRFSSICDNYGKMKFCLGKCDEAKAEHSVTSGFASMEFICVRHRAEFEEHLPCLARHEQSVMRACHRQTALTLDATKALQQAPFPHNDVSKLRSLLNNLCRNTTEIINCMRPETARVCGARVANMLRDLVALSFSNIGQFFEQVGLKNRAPASCKRLARLGAQIDYVDLDYQNDGGGSKRAAYEDYLNGAPSSCNWGQIVVALLLAILCSNTVFS